MHTFTPHTNKDGIGFSLSVSSDTVRDLEVGVSARTCLIIQKPAAGQTHALAVNTAPEAAAAEAAFVSVAAALEVVLDAAAALVLAELLDAAEAFVFDALLELLPTTPFEAAPAFFLSVAMLVSSFFLESSKAIRPGMNKKAGATYCSVASFVSRSDVSSPAACATAS